MNPFAPLYARCNAGTNASKLAGLPDFPRIIDIELTNACNFRCLFCPTGNRQMTRPTGMMNAATFAEIVRQCEEHGTGLRFIGWGEPTLHEGIVEAVALASEAGLPTHINTNGSNLSRILDCCRAGLSSLKFSFQGVDRQSYAEARNIDYFDRLRSIVRVVFNERGKRGTPFIHVSTTTTSETEDDIREFRWLFERYADAVSVGKTIFAHLDLGATRLKPSERETLARLMGYGATDLHHPSPCPEVYDKLTIQWDGSVRVCCNDFDGVTDLGNVNETPLADIWRHKVIEDYRKRLAEGEYAGPLCGSCYHYMEGTA